MATRLMEGSFSGANVEVGYATLANYTAKVKTKLSKIYAAFVMYEQAPGAGSQAWCDKSIDSIGQVTFYDNGVMNKKFQYILIGLT